MGSARLTTKGLLYLGGWLLGAAFAGSVPGFMPLWFSLGIIVAVWIVLDRGSAVPFTEKSVLYHFESAPEVGRETTVTVRVPIDPERREEWGRTVFSAPDSGLLRWIVRECVPVLRVSNLEEEAVGELRVIGRKVGYASNQPIRVRRRSRGGFWIRRARIPATGGMRVSPPLTKIPPATVQAILSRQRQVLFGKRALIRSRGRDLFHSVREFRYPDPPEHIDPKKSAKLQSLMVRTFEHEAAHHIVLLLDSGRTMLGEVAGSLKYQYYLSALLALAEEAIRARDSVSFVSFSQRPNLVLKKVRSLSALQPILVGAEGVQPREEESNYDQLAPLVRSLAGQCSVVLLFTDPSRPAAQQALVRALTPLAREHVVILLGLLDKGFDLTSSLQRLDPRNAKRAELMELTYSYWTDHEYRRFAARMRGIGVGSILLPEEGWMDAVNRTYREVRDSLRL